MSWSDDFYESGNYDDRVDIPDGSSDEYYISMLRQARVEAEAAKVRAEGAAEKAKSDMKDRMAVNNARVSRSSVVDANRKTVSDNRFSAMMNEACLDAGSGGTRRVSVPDSSGASDGSAGKKMSLRQAFHDATINLPTITSSMEGRNADIHRSDPMVKFSVDNLIAKVREVNTNLGKKIMEGKIEGYSTEDCVDNTKSGFKYKDILEVVDNCRSIV